MNIVNLFLSAAERHADHTAIIEKDKTISYAQLQIGVRETAAYFTSMGIKSGDRVLVFVPMSIDLYRIVLALFYIGATAVFLDEWVSKKRLEICCKLADCTGFIGVFKARIFAFFSSELRQIPIKLSMSKRKQALVSPLDVEPSQTALITFTTGSIGVPKAADRSHEFLKEQFDALIHEIDPNPADIDMSVLPIVLFVNLGIGCTSIIADFKMTKPDKMNPQKIAKQLKDHKANRLIASPFFVKRLAEHAIEKGFVYEGIEKNFTGGAPVFPNEAQLYLKAFNNAVSTIVYGSTEAEPISSVDAKQLVDDSRVVNNGLLVGELYHKIELRIIEIREETIGHCVKAGFEKLKLEQGKVGEIVVAGSHVLKQYFKNEDAFRENKIVVDGTVWHRTGDSGYVKNEQLYLTGRCKQLIAIDEGYISPFIVESKLQDINGITNGTVIQQEKEVLLIVETSLGVTEVASLVNGIQHDRIIVVDLIPKDPRHNSKIDYELLKQQLEN